MNLEPDDETAEPSYRELLGDLGHEISDGARAHPKLATGLATYAAASLGMLGYLGEQAIATIIGGL